MRASLRSMSSDSKGKVFVKVLKEESPVLKLYGRSVPFKTEPGAGLAVHSLIRALRRQRQGDLFEFESSLVYIVNSRTVRAM